MIPRQEGGRTLKLSGPSNNLIKRNTTFDAGTMRAMALVEFR